MNGSRSRIAVAALGVVGLGIAGYLTYVHYLGLPPLCFASGCETVQTSRYAVMFGVPVPVIGIIGYLAILLSLMLRGLPGRVATLILSWIGLAASVYFTYLEIFRIKAICQWCVASAIVMLLIAVIATVAYLRQSRSVPDQP